MTEMEKHHIVTHIKKCSNLKKALFFIIFLTIFLKSFEVSEDIFAQLTETHLLIKEKRLLKARESLDYMLEWFGDELNPLEKDLIRYFQGEIYLLEGKPSLAISNFTAILTSNLLDKASLEEIKTKLAKLYLASGNSRFALQFLDSTNQDSKTIAMRYIAYKELNDFPKAYQNIVLMLEKNAQNLTLWKEYLDVSVQVGIKPKTISIDKFLLEFHKKDDFIKFYQLFKLYDMEYQLALFIDKFFKFAIEQIDNQMIDEVIGIYLKLMELNKAKNFIILILHSKKDHVLKYRFKLVDIYIKIGEFEEALDILNDIEKNRSFGKAHIYRGQILFLQGRYFEAREEFFQALRFQTSKHDGVQKLNMIQKFLD